jgi:hypothetical protein
MTYTAAGQHYCSLTPMVQTGTYDYIRTRITATAGGS